MAASIVQTAVQAAGNTPSQVTFGAAPTNGNWIIAAVNWWSGSQTLDTGWNLILNVTTAGKSNVSLYYKKAGASESTTQSPFSTPSQNDRSLGMWEVSGLTGTWLTDFIAEHHATDIAGATSVSTTSFNTTAINTMVLGMIGGNVATGTTAQAPNMSGGTSTQDGNYAQTAGVSTRPSFVLFHDLFTGSGSAVVETAAWASQAQQAEFYALISLQWTAAAISVTANYDSPSVGITAGAMTATGDAEADYTSPTVGITAGSYSVSTDVTANYASPTVTVDAGSYDATTEDAIPFLDSFTSLSVVESLSGSLRVTSTSLRAAISYIGPVNVTTLDLRVVELLKKEVRCTASYLMVVRSIRNRGPYGGQHIATRDSFGNPIHE